MCVPQLNPKGLCRVDTGVHAGDEEELPSWGSSEVAVDKGRRVPPGGGLDMLGEGRHGARGFWESSAGAGAGLAAG